MTKQELESATKLSLRSAEATKAVLAEIDAKDAEIESLTATLAAMREVLEKIADGPCTAPPYHDENDCPNFTGKRKVCNRCKVRLFLRQSDAGSKLLERHAEELAAKDAETRRCINAGFQDLAKARDALADANQRAEAADAALTELREAVSPGRIGKPGYYVGVAARLRSLDTRIVAKDSPEIEECSREGPHIGPCNGYPRATDCPPSGILQEWQPWNGK